MANSTARREKRPPASMVRALVTPEGVDLRVRLADAGSRAAAFLLDMVILSLSALLVTVVALFGLYGMGAEQGQPIFVVWLVLIFFLRNVYFIAFETGRRAATPGKRIVGVRVASRDGTGLAIDQVIARNLMREIELFLPLSMIGFRTEAGIADTLTTIFGMCWTLLFAFFPLFNRDRLRIGDLLAGTWVVEMPRRKLAEDLAARQTAMAHGYAFSMAQLDAYGIAELQTLETVLRGNDEPAVRTVAEAIGKKIGAVQQAREARPFLQAYYIELRSHLERKMLLGKRRVDKHDR